MTVEFDADKDAGNVEKHGISLARAEEMDVRAFLEDVRAGYGEKRYRAWGFIDGEAYSLAYTLRAGVLRPISLRRAHAKEIKRYVT